MKGVRRALSFNTAISFLTNTNWQTYGGEATMSHLSQMFALVWHQFISAAVGMALAAAFIRALVRRRSDDARQLLGRHDPLDDACAVADLVHLRARVHEPGRDPELPRQQDGHHRREPRASTRPRRR